MQWMSVGEFQRAFDASQALIKVSDDDLFRQISGICQYRLGHYSEAISTFREALTRCPESIDGYNNLGNVLIETGAYADAIPVLEEGVRRTPNNPEVWMNLARAYNQTSQPSRALEAASEAVRLDPSLIPPRMNIASVLWETGHLDESIAAWQEVLAQDPNNIPAWSALIGVLYYSDTFNPLIGKNVAQTWGRSIAKPSIWRESINRNGRIRVGLISGDFCRHPVATQVLRVLKEIDKNKFEVFSYSNLGAEDDVTEAIREHSDHWFVAWQVEDDRLAHKIAEDDLDILIDLSGHTSRNRMTALAYKPAPIIATMLGFFATTGHPAIDYFIVDPIQIRPEEEQFFTEKIVRFESSASAWRMPESAPEVSPLPALKNGFVTFGTFSNIAKITRETITNWSEVLRRIPTSRLRIDRRGAEDPFCKQRILSFFSEQEIELDRIYIDPSIDCLDYLDNYSKVDVVLDTVPFTGSTTTIESLWMGVPVVSLSSSTPVGHLSEVFLKPTGNADWVTESETEFVDTVVSLCSDIPQLSRIRSELRQKVKASQMFSEGAFTKNLEAVIEELVSKSRSLAA